MPFLARRCASISMPMILGLSIVAVSHCVIQSVSPPHTCRSWICGSIDQVIEACGAKTLPLVDYLGKKVDRLDVVRAALDTVGASDETKTLAKDMLGEITFSAGGETTRTGHGVGRVAAKYEQLAEDKE